MPFKTDYLTSLDESLEFMDFVSYDDAKDGKFDQTFSTEIDMIEWQDWMKWDGSVEFGAMVPLYRPQTSSPTLNINSWPIKTENIGTGEIPVTLINANEFPFRVGEFATRSIGDTSMSSGIITPQEVRQSAQNYPILTKAEVLALQAIAMPYLKISEVDIGNPSIPLAMDSLSTTPAPSPESETRTRKNQKRKSITGADVPKRTCQSKRRGHNAIEKRYRTNINDKINRLRDGVPALSPSGSKFGDDIDKDSEGEADRKGTQQKYGKAAILTRALEYIKHLECTTKRLCGDVDCLNLRVGAFEKLAINENKTSSNGKLLIANEVK